MTAVAIRHHHVEEDQADVRFVIREQPQRLGAVARRDHAVAGPRQLPDGELADRRLVLGDQNQLAAAAATPAPVAPAAGLTAAAAVGGRYTVIVVPRPTAVSISITPS